MFSRLKSEENRIYYSRLRKVAIPIAIQGIVVAVLGLVDNIMVGFLGEAELAAVGIAIQIFNIHYMILFGFVGGTATYTSQFYGSGNKEKIRNVIGFSIRVGMIFSIIFFIVGFFFTKEYLALFTPDPHLIDLAAIYVKAGSWVFLVITVSYPLQVGLKATQQTNVPMVMGLIVFMSNVVLNYLLIFGKFGFPRWGVYGASIATLISRVIELVIVVIFCITDWNYFKGPFKDYFGGSWLLKKKVIKNATPTTINEMLWSMAQSAYVAAFARIGTSAYAGYQAATTIRTIFHFAAFSLGEAALIMIGEKLGQGKDDEAFDLGGRLLRSGIIVGIAIGVFMASLSWPLIHLFNLSAAGFKDGALCLVVYGLTMFITLYSGMLVAGVLRAGGDTKFAMITECSTSWFIGVPIAFIAAVFLGWPVYFSLLATRIEDVIKCIIFGRRYKSRKWIKTMISEEEY